MMGAGLIFVGSRQCLQRQTVLILLENLDVSSQHFPVDSHFQSLPSELHRFFVALFPQADLGIMEVAVVIIHILISTSLNIGSH